MANDSFFTVIVQLNNKQFTPCFNKVVFVFAYFICLTMGITCHPFLHMYRFCYLYIYIYFKIFNKVGVHSVKLVDARVW